VADRERLLHPGHATTLGRAVRPCASTSRGGGLREAIATYERVSRRQASGALGHGDIER